MDHSRGNAIELIEGTQAAVNMTATANPLPIDYQWSKESTALELEKIPSDLRLSVSGGVLNISNVRREDSGYYTISATNAEGTTQTKIKIDVLYAPRYVSLLSWFLLCTTYPYVMKILVRERGLLVKIYFLRLILTLAVHREL